MLGHSGFINQVVSKVSFCSVLVLFRSSFGQINVFELVNSEISFGMEDKTSCVLSIPYTYAYDMNESEWSEVLCDHGFKLKVGPGLL